MIAKTIRPELMVRTIRSLQAMLTPDIGQHTPKDICDFYTETRKYLVRYSEQVNSRFIREKTDTLEALHVGEFGRGGALGGGIFGMLMGTKLRGARVDERLELKLERINNGLNAIASVIESPELEKMYYNA